MIESKSTPGSDAPPSAPATPVADWSDVRGFQVVSQTGAGSAAAPGGAEALQHALARELEARAARFAQSVDQSIVLASDGVIRWLGNPIARLIGGDDSLKPRSVLLADEALAPEARQVVETRLALWIAAHIHKVLGPLEALAEPGEIGEAARELAGRVVQAFGVLERERVRAQVKNLDQSARATLRKLGVRFGSLYIYVPALLKPGARTLCSQLWSLRRGTEPGAERLLAFAAAGRTSFPAETPLGAETYRIAGFRLCGDRVVRVDIVERLTDLIRAAISDRIPSRGGAAGEAAEFVITPQMTSLTGCAGDSFASLLRSLGFESHRVKRVDRGATSQKPVAAAAVEGAPPALCGSDTGEHSEPQAAATDSDAEPTLTAPMQDTDDAPPPEEEALFAGEQSESAPIEVARFLPLESVLKFVEGSPAAAEVALAPLAEDEWIEVWRAAPRRRPSAPRRGGVRAREETAGRPLHAAREQIRAHSRDRDATVKPAPASQGHTETESLEISPKAATAEAPRDGHQTRGAAHRHGGRRKIAFKEPEGEAGRVADGARPPREPNKLQPKKEPRAQPVDMNSPFAKLLALKPLLERRDKRT